MNIAIVDKTSNELLAFISDKQVISHDNVEVINYGDTEPIFEDVNGHVFVKNNSFIIQ